MQYFPTINFNPEPGTIPGNTSGVGTTTRPWVDITTDLNGNYTGGIVAQGNGYQAKRQTNLGQPREADQRAGVRLATSESARRFSPGSTWAR